MDENTEQVHQAITLTGDNFKEEVQNFDGLVLVDFWAAWCGPCHVMAPRVEELAVKYVSNPQVRVAKMDVDAPENEAIAFEQRVMSLPTFKLFRDGKVIDELIGLCPTEHLDELITRNLQPAA